MMTAATLAHLLITVALVVSYTVLTALGHDANAVLTALVGYLGGGAVQKATSSSA